MLTLSCRGSSSVAERQLPKLNVAGSIPVSRSSSPFIPVKHLLLVAETVNDPINRSNYLYLRYIVTAIKRAAFQ
jgi:hypothetical protein